MSGFGSSGSGLGRVQGQNPFGSGMNRSPAPITGPGSPMYQAYGNKPLVGNPMTRAIDPNQGQQFDPWARSRDLAGIGNKPGYDMTGGVNTFNKLPGATWSSIPGASSGNPGLDSYARSGGDANVGFKTYENALLPGQSYPGFGNRYGPDQHQPGRGTPNTNPIPPGFQPPGAGVPWSMGGGLQTYGPDQHQPNRGTPNTTTQGPWTPGPTWPGMITSQPPMSTPFVVNQPNQLPPVMQGQAPQMIPGTNRPMPPGAFIDEYGIARRAPETPMNPGAKQFGQYTPGPNGFTLDQSGGLNRINGTLFSAEGLNQGGIAAPNYVDYLNRMFRR